MCSIRRHVTSGIVWYVLLLPSAADFAEKQYGQWTTAHRSALNGWFMANYALYRRIRPVSPYGFDPDLAAKLQGIIDQIDTQHKYKDTDFFPLRIADVRQALDALNQEVIRSAEFVGPLISRGNLSAAASVNSAAEMRFEEMITNSTIQESAASFGINKELLGKNKAWLKTLLTSQPRNSLNPT